MRKKVIIAAGGTGGHVYPAIAIANQLKNSLPELEIMFIGGKLDTNPYFKNYSYDYASISCSTFSLKNPFTLISSLIAIIRGYKQSRKVYKSFQPDLVVGFGSYHTLPALLAAKVKGKKIILHEANSMPGKVNRLMAPFALYTGIHFPKAAELLKGKTVEVGLPLRNGFALNFISKEQARIYYGLDPRLKTLLIFGGSQGAHAINKLIGEGLSFWMKTMQVIHITGDESQAIRLKKLYETHGISSVVKAFETEMNYAWQAADFAICRAGAGTIAEALEFEVPAILIPYPYAADDHQNKNAVFFADMVGGGEFYQQSMLNAALLVSIVHRFMEDENIEARQKSMHTYKQNFRAESFTSIIEKILIGSL